MYRLFAVQSPVNNNNDHITNSNDNLTSLEPLSPVVGLDLFNGRTICYNDTDEANSYNNNNVDDNNLSSHRTADNISSYDVGEIVLGITTCRRLQHFYETVDALQHALGPLPSQLVTKVIVVDDSSSAIDRAKMMAKYSSFEFILKSTQMRGHAHSMNILIDSFLNYSSKQKIQFNNKRKQYFMYIEDDWRLLSTSIIHYTLGNSINQIRKLYSDLITHHNIHLYNYNNNNDNTNLSPQQKEPHLFCEVLIMSMHILRSQKVQQVLFNDQGGRQCAVADSNCDIQSIGKSGWARKLTTNIHQNTMKDNVNNHNDKLNKDINMTLHYNLHEFGLVRKFNLPNHYRNHDFSIWPGLSLNPGLWDLDEIHKRISRCKHDSSNHYNHSNNMNKDSTNFHSAHTSDRERMLLFDPTDLLFEQRYSVTAYLSNLSMGYLSGLFFEHIGDISAYQLNNFSRPWHA